MKWCVQIISRSTPKVIKLNFDFFTLKERKEHEEYLKLKESFLVDEEGFDEDPEEDKENKLEIFIQYIKDTKVVVLEDLAAHFKMKTDDTIDRVTTLVQEGKLTGNLFNLSCYCFRV